jgi:NDP-sugar pyrophosphorylase family protein
MVPVLGKPILEWNIEHLVCCGVDDDIVINLHYLGTLSGSVSVRPPLGDQGALFI